jgi:hypothetical protein
MKHTKVFSLLNKLKQEDEALIKSLLEYEFLIFFG